MTDIHDLTVTELAAAIRDGELSPVEITDHYLDRIDRLNEQVGAFYTVTHDLAREQAAAAEKAAAACRRDDGAGAAAAAHRRADPDQGPEHGRRGADDPGQHVYADTVAPEDDYVVAALREAGIVITGQDRDAGVRPALLHRDQDRPAGPDARGT